MHFPLEKALLNYRYTSGKNIHVHHKVIDRCMTQIIPNILQSTDMDKILHADVETDDVISFVLITKNSIDIFKLTNSEDIFACGCMTCHPSYVYKIITQVKIFNFRIP